MRDDDKALKIALASALPTEFKEAIALGNKYAEYKEARRYLYYLNKKGFLDDETLQEALQNVEEYFAIRGLHDFQGRLRDDELSNLGALSNAKGYDVKNDIPILKEPEERISSIKELMRDDNSDADSE